MTRMVLTGRCQPPLAWLALVNSQPPLAMKSYVPTTIDLTPEKINHMHNVQDTVNDGFKYEREAKDVWGKWSWRRIIGLTGKSKWIRVGDCDDFVVEKLYGLLGFGFGGSLHLVICRYGTTGHLVLAVDTSKTTFILDNRYPGVWDWEDRRHFSKYRWIASSVPGRTMWARIGLAPTLRDLLPHEGGDYA